MGKYISLFILALTALCGAVFALSNNESFAVYYSDKDDPLDFAAFDFVILDEETHPPLEGFADQGIQTLGYLSCVELADFRSYFPKIKSRALFLHENPHFSGCWFVDIREKKWRRFLVNQVIPKMIEEGFDGLFLDTLDDAVYLESQDPVRYAGMTNAAIDLVEAIRNRYPKMPIMVNRGYELLEEIGDMITAVLGEEVYTRFNFETKSYENVPEDEQQYQCKILKDAKEEFPQLKVYTLDYWNATDDDGVSEIYQKQRDNGFIPYVSTFTLNEIVQDPS